MVRRCFQFAAAIALMLACCLTASQAHDARPAYLSLKETASGRYTVVWRTPMVAGLRLPLVLKMPDETTDLREPTVLEASDSLVERRWIAVGAGGLSGKRIRFAGLEFGTLDTLVRIERLDGTILTEMARPSRPWIDVAATQSRWTVARAYVLEGFDHILLGVDHLLFVLGLLILVKGVGRLVASITAFTVAHSITLAVSTLGWIAIPAAPVEACIALSIMFVALEIVRRGAGRESLTIRFPWVVAFVFGLLHGFGFAGALREVGLPHDAIPTALLFFNVGVELGQLLFVAAILAIGSSVRWAVVRLPRTTTDGMDTLARIAPAYAIGGTAAFWLIERCASWPGWG